MYDSDSEYNNNHSDHSAQSDHFEDSIDDEILNKLHKTNNDTSEDE